MSDDERRGEYVAGLRALADALEGSALAIPTAVGARCIDIYLHDADAYLAWRALLDDVQQAVDEGVTPFRLRARGTLRGARVLLTLADEAAFDVVTAPLRPELAMPSAVTA